MKVKKGNVLSVQLQNQTGEETIIHWHGLHVDWRNDAHPMFAVRNGASYDYRFPVQNRGGTYWYHPHPHRLTAKQAYGGLAGFFIVE